MSSVFKWMEKNWPFSSSSDFICFANINSDSCPVIRMEIKTSLSTPYEIELLVLSKVSFSNSDLQSQTFVTVDLFPDNSSLKKSFSGYLTSFAFQGTAYSLVEDESSFVPEAKDSQRNVYSLTLSPYTWNANQKNKTVIFHNEKKSSVVESVLKPYKTNVVFSDSNSELKEVITQYKESDFKFAVRLMEESGYFCYYDFSSKEAAFKIKNAKDVSSSSSDGLGTLRVVREIHDNFDFDQILNLKVFDKSPPNVSDSSASSLDPSKISDLNDIKEQLETNQSYTNFSCEASSYNLFTGDYFVVKVENHDSFLISPLGLNQTFFVEKSRLVLEFDQVSGWYVRNYLEGFVSTGSVPEYRLERTTSTPMVVGQQKAYVCGYVKNSLYVNSEGCIKVRLTWIPFKEGSSTEKAAALANAQKNKEAYVAGRKTAAEALDSQATQECVDKAKDGVDSLADITKDGLSAGSDAAKVGLASSATSDLKEGEVLSVAGSGLSTGTAIVGAEVGKVVVDQISSLGKTAVDGYYESLKNDLKKRAEEDSAFVAVEDFLQDKTAIWSVENEDTRALTGWIPVAQWGGSGNSFGNYSFPRVGQIVTVSFTDGNPDFPVVTGTSYSVSKKNDSFSNVFNVANDEGFDFPYAITSKDDFTKDSSNNGGIFSDSFGALKDSAEEINSSLLEMVKSPSLLLDHLEGVSVPDLIPFQCRKESFVGGSNQSEFETNEIQSASGNLIIKSFAYDDSHRTNRAGWNEISFFNQRYNEAIRISSGHYLFLHSKDIVHFIAPKLLKEQLGIRCTTIAGNKYEIISGKCNEFYGDHRISYFPGPMARQEVEANDGMAIERLQMEITGKFMDKINGFMGAEQTFATFLNKGLCAYISLLGDYVALALGGNILFTTIVGGFNVNANASMFNILGVFSIVVSGYMAIKAASKFDVNTAGTITLTSGNSIHLSAGKRLHLTSSGNMNVMVGNDICVKTGKIFEVNSGKSIELNSAVNVVMNTAKSLSINAGKSIDLKTADLSITASKLSISVLKTSISSGLAFDITSTKVGISGAIVKLG